MDSYHASFEHRFQDDVDLWEALDGLCAALAAATERLGGSAEESQAQMSSESSGMTLRRDTVDELRAEFAAKHVEPHAVGRSFHDTSNRRRHYSVWLFVTPGYEVAHISIHADSDTWIDSMKGAAERYLAKYPPRVVRPRIEFNGVEISAASPKVKFTTRALKWLGENILVKIFVGVAVAVVAAALIAIFGIGA